MDLHFYAVDRPSWAFKSDKGMVWSDMSKPADFFFFSLQEHTTKFTVKILAANMYKY
jgi:hypothetical protein